MAALTMSMDSFGGRYAAAVETNGHRVEMITEHNLRNMLLPLFHHWLTKFGGKPENLPRHIYYFRDGVSEGQYAHVLNQEVADMKKILEEKYGVIIKQVSTCF
jgi:eukaryotic translation initiation factor 2C